MKEDTASTDTTATPPTWIVVLCSLGCLIAVSAAYHFLAGSRTRGRKLAPHVIYWVVSIAAIVLLPFLGVAEYIFSALTITMIATVFPIYESVRAVCTPEEEDDKSWLQYWMVGGVLFIVTQWVNASLLGDTGILYWYGSMMFFSIWLFFPVTDGAALIYDYITEPFLAPKLRPIQAKMNSFIMYAYQTLVNAVHLWILWIIFLFLPAGLKRTIAVCIGTVYPLVCSITAAATETVDDDTYWLTYWSVYGVLFLIMSVLDVWMGWVPGFYTLMIFSTVYLMLPMFQGSEKVRFDMTLLLLNSCSFLGARIQYVLDDSLFLCVGVSKHPCATLWFARVVVVA